MAWNGFPRNRVRFVASLVAASLVMGATAVAVEDPAPGGGGGPVVLADHTFALERVTTGFDGSEANNGSTEVSVSADGQQVAFGSFATNLHPDGAPAQVHRYDDGSGTIELASVDADGHPIGGHAPWISGDGDVVAFSGAPFDPAHPEVYRSAIFRTDFSDAEPAAEIVDPALTTDSEEAVLNHDGSVVAFVSGTWPTGPGTGGPWTVYVAGAGAPAAIGTLGEATMPQRPAISPDGTKVAFLRYGAEPGWTLWVDDDLADGDPAVQRAVVDADGEDSSFYGAPAFAGNDAVVFVTATEGYRIEVLDLTSDTSQPEPLPLFSGFPPFSGAIMPTASSDGRFITFTAVDDLGVPQIYLYDDAADATYLVTHDADGNPSERDPAAAGGLPRGVVSADGTTIAVESSAPDLVAGDTNHDSDIFLTPNVDTELLIAWPDDAELDVTGIGDTSAALSWPAAPDATGYRVYVGGTVFGEVAGTTTEVDNLSPGTLYGFSVRALVGDRVSSDRLATTATTTDGGGVRPIVPLALNTGDHGTGVRLDWEAVSDPGITSFVVQRAPVVGEFATIAADIPLTQTTYLDATAASDTTYRYRVMVVEGGTAQPYTEESTHRTPALEVYSFTTGVPSGLLDPGATLPLRLGGYAAATAEVVLTTRSWLAENGDVLDTPREIQHTVALTRSPSDGTVWEASFVLPPGTGEIAAATGRLIDAVGTVKTTEADQWNLGEVAGGLDVDIADQGELDGAELEVFGSWWSAVDRQLTGGGLQAVDGLPAGDDYSVRVRDAEGRVLAEQQDVVVRPGLRTEVALEPRRLVHAAVKVLDPNGTTMPWQAVTVYDADGEYLQTAYADWTGIAVVRGLSETASLRLFTRTWWPSDLLNAPTAERTVAVVPGDNAIDLQYEKLPTGRITGRVTVNGQAAPRATVDVTHGAPATSRQVITDGEGDYDVEVVAGDADMTVSSWGASRRTLSDIAVAPGATVTNDVDLVAPKPYDVKVRLFAKYPGHDVEEVTIAGWRLTAHFETLFVFGPGIHRQVPFNGATFQVLANPGTPLRFCGGGQEGGLGSGCGEAVALPADNTEPVELDLTLIQPQRIVGDIVDEAGEPVSMWTATLARPDGAIVNQFASPGSGRLDATARGVGELTLAVHGFAAEAGEYVAVSSAPIPVTIVSDGVVDVGDIVLRPVGAAFAGSGNEVRALKPSVAAGTTAGFRVAYQNNGSTEMAGAVVRVQLPEGRALLPNGLLLDGAPVADPAVDGGTVDVPVGDLAPGASGFVTYYVPVGDAAPGDRLTTRASMVVGEMTTVLGSASAEVAGVTLIGPTTTNEPTIVLRGDGPPEATVELFDGDDRIGAAVVGKGGAWTQTARLADRGDGTTHQLRAVVALDGATLTSEPLDVLLDQSDVVVTSMSISQEDATKKTWDPRKGVARFPLVWVPGRPFDIEIEFSDNARVENVVAFVGERWGQAELREGVFHAQVMADGSGQIAVEYDVVAAPVTFEPRPADPEELRTRLPLWASSFDLTGEPATADDGSISVDYTLPGRGDAEATTTILVTDEEYEMTAEDAEFEDATGVPVFGAETTVELTDDGTVVITQTAYVPRAVLPEADAELAAVRMLTGDVRAAAAPMMKGAIGTLVDAVKTRIKTELKEDVEFEDVKDWAESAQEKATEGGNTYDELGDLYEQIADAAPEDQAALRTELDGVLNQAAATDVGTSLADVGFVFAAPTGPVGEAAMTVLSEAISTGLEKGLERAQKRIERKIDLAVKKKNFQDRLKDLDRALEGGEGSAEAWCRYFLAVYEDGGRRPQDMPPDPDCNPDPPDDRRRTPTGDNPVIVDPSGFVFEAVESNRLEGVTTTALFSTSPDGPWEVWDAGPYAQENPLATGADGRYAWDVPFGWWKVEYRKDGYEVGSSEPMEVLPPRFDVNEGLISLAAPEVESVALGAGASAIAITFDKHMIPASVGPNLTVVGPNGAVAGTVAAVAPEPGVDDQPLARTFAFTPDDQFPLGTLTVTVGGARSYADRAVAAPVVRELAVTAAPPAGGGGGGGGGGVGGGGGAKPPVPTAAQPVTVAVAVPGGGSPTMTPGGDAGVGSEYRVLGSPVQVTAPPATVDKPLTLTFRVFSGAMAPGQVLVLFRDGQRVPVGCAADGSATPDPCVASMVPGDGFWEVVVRSSHASTWAAATAVAGSTAAACPVGRFPARPFPDVTAANVHAGAVSCLAGRGIARGTSAAAFAPAAAISRAQMASFVARLLASSGVALPTVGAAPPFSDVTGVHAAAIAQLAQVGVAKGTGGGRFEPGRPVTRAEMATLLVRALELAEGRALPGAGNAFDDDGGSTHQGAIDKAAAAGIALGTGARTFAPDAPVRRDQMASFVARTLNRLVLVGKAS